MTEAVWMAVWMGHVDALSRIVCFTDSIPLEKELQIRQLQDSKLKIIAESFKYEESNKFDLMDLFFEKVFTNTGLLYQIQ